MVKNNDNKFSKKVKKIDSKVKDSGQRVKNVILSIAIAIIFAFFVAYTIELVYPSPGYNDFCDNTKETSFREYTEEECIEIGGEWQDFSKLDSSYELRCNEEKVKDLLENETVLRCTKTLSSEGYCNPNHQCYEIFDSAQEKHNRIYFIIALIIGITVFTISSIMGIVSVSAGLMVGSVLTMLVATMRYWRHSNEFLRVAILGIVLAILIWLGYKKLNK
jgi:hypothetical protein